MRKHPVIFGLFLLVVVGILFFLFIYGMTSLTRDGITFTLKDQIGVVMVKGVISDSKGVVDQLDSYGEDENVRAVVVRIDSPGGGVVPSQEIYDTVLQLKKKKKVVVSMGSVAASGGYYIACAADKIVANPGTVTGSIGVIAQFSEIKELLDKIGLKPTIIKSGKFKDVGSPVREMTPEDRNLLQGVVDDIYDQFLESVAVNRNIPKEKIREIADGRILTGRQAFELGLIDYLGSMEYTINVAAKLSGIEGKPQVVYPKEKRPSLLRYFLEETAGAICKELKEEWPGMKYKLNYETSF